MKKLKYLVTVFLCAVSFLAVANSTIDLNNDSAILTDDLLPTEEAFKFETIVFEENKLLARFSIADDYYLYKDKIRFSSGDNNMIINRYQLPNGIMHLDAHFGEVEILKGVVEIPISVTYLNQTESVALKAAYQGCAASGVCYPPEVTELSIKRY